MTFESSRLKIEDFDEGECFRRHWSKFKAKPGKMGSRGGDKKSNDDTVCFATATGKRQGIYRLDVVHAKLAGRGKERINYVAHAKPRERQGTYRMTRRRA